MEQHQTGEHHDEDDDDDDDFRVVRIIKISLLGLERIAQSITNDLGLRAFLCMMDHAQTYTNLYTFALFITKLYLFAISKYIFI